MSKLVVLPSLTGIAYRATSLRYHAKAGSPKGSRDNAGRFNRKGVSALYVARSPLTAVMEYYASGDPTPLVLVPFEYDLKRIVDITGDLKGWPKDWQNWECNWRAALSSRARLPDCASWRCGDDAIARNATAILYPSKYDPSGTALAIFTEDAVQGTCSLTPLDPFGTIGEANPLRV